MLKFCADWKVSCIILLPCLPSLPSCMDMQIESQVTQVIYPGQDKGENWLTALSIFFYLLLASSTVLKQGFVRSCHLLPLLAFWVITMELENWTQCDCMVRTGLLVYLQGLFVFLTQCSSIFLMAFCVGSSGRCSHIALHTSEWALGIMSKNQSFSPKLLT